MFEIHLPGDGTNDPANPGTGLSYGIAVGTGISGYSLAISLEPLQIAASYNVLGVVGSVSVTASGAIGYAVGLGGVFGI